MKKVIILGGSGFIGSRLSELLIRENYETVIFTRSKKTETQNPKIRFSYWNPENGSIDINELQNAYGIINFTGENIGGKKWTEKQKDKILKSRINPLAFLFKTLSEHNIKPRVLVSSSAVGYYGTFTSDTVFSEEMKEGTDFLASVCNEWEKEAYRFEKLGIRVGIIRTSVVLADNGGALKKMIFPSKIGIHTILGSGKQYFPWIHLDDLCKMFLFLVENETIQGTFNGVASENITNRQFIESLAKISKFKIIMLKIPSWFLKFVLGEMAVMLLSGSKISNKKIKNTGFTFEFNTLNDCLKNLITAQNH